MFRLSRHFTTTHPTLSLVKFFDSPTGFTWTEPKLGPSWDSSSLRQKSFENLHELWWKCLIENNKLLSQQQEARRFKVYFSQDERVKQVFYRVYG
jgi:large subunit ribosomal protein L47